VTRTAALAAAIEATRTEIRSKHPDVPDVVVTIAAGSTGRTGVTYGHFAQARWVDVAGQEQLHELFVGGEGLQRGPLATLGTLLHEAAHGLGAARGIQNTSRQGRYHNARFRTLADELGIDVTHSPSQGWSTTTVPATTAEQYAPQLAQLRAAITAYRRAEAGGRARTSSNNPIALTCDCGRRIRAAAAVVAQGPITCGLCQTPFSAAQEDS
jgi:hypothetical protein